MFALAAGCAPKQKPFTDYVNPLLGTATLWDSVDLGFKPTKRTWGAEVFPGSSLPAGQPRHKIPQRGGLPV